jgi:5-methyltetrahydrofolate--homocysteine methyltransferase
VHTAVKIEPHYEHPVVHVLDASRAVTVVSNLLSHDHHEEYIANTKAEYEQVRKNYAAHQSSRNTLAIDDARKNKLILDFDENTVSKPIHQGVKVFENIKLQELIPFIDWTPFFQSWELAGRYPQILEDDVVGEQAKNLFADAQAMLQRITDQQLLRAKAVTGIFPANAVGDDIEVNTHQGVETFITLRQQTQKATGQSNLALADFIAPTDSGIQDYIGSFAVCSGFGQDELVKTYEAAHDDYSAILVKAIADRLAEALAEYMHQKIRRELWGFAANESLSNEELIDEKYRGIRPAPGYPACPDHLEKKTIWKILDVEKNIGLTLTESLAMYPAAAVSGYYFAHPSAKYFGLGKINEDQLADYARRRGVSRDEAAKWLSPVLI